MKIRGNTIFYVPNRKEKLRTRRATRRREYRRFMGKMVSELSKKIGRERLRDNRNKTRQHLFTNSSFVNKRAALQKRRKHGFRIQWHAKKHAFWGTQKRDFITKRKTRTPSYVKDASKCSPTWGPSARTVKRDAVSRPLNSSIHKINDTTRENYICSRTSNRWRRTSGVSIHAASNKFYQRNGKKRA